jgi:hypothetical protein
LGASGKIMSTTLMHVSNGVDMTFTEKFRIINRFFFYFSEKFTSSSFPIRLHPIDIRALLTCLCPPKLTNFKKDIQKEIFWNNLESAQKSYKKKDKWSSWKASSSTNLQNTETSGSTLLKLLHILRN